MEPLKISSHAPFEKSKEQTKQQVLTFFKGCQFRKCLSPHCKNFIGTAELGDLRENPEKSVGQILEMIKNNELKIFCHQPFDFTEHEISHLETCHAIFSFSFLQMLNLDSQTRYEVFDKIKIIAEQNFASLSFEKKESVLSLFEFSVEKDLIGLEKAAEPKLKDFDLFETFCLFFAVFSFVFEIENFSNVPRLQKLFSKLSFLDFYHPVFKEKLPKDAFAHFINQKCLEKANENLQNLLALQIAELGRTAGYSVSQANTLRAICAAIEFLYNLNTFLPTEQQLLPKSFINESLHQDFDVKTSTLLFIKESVLSRSQNFLSPLLFALNSPNDFNFLAFPFLLPNETKVEAMNFENRISQSLEIRSSLSNFENPLMLLFSNNLYLELVLRRDNLLEDALNQLAGKGKGAHLRKGLKIRFQGEPGVDEGGLTKEFFQLLTQQLFDPSFGMFVEKNERCLWFDSKSFECSINFELVGTLLGLALYNETILPLRFPIVVYKKLKAANNDNFSLRDEIGLEDLRELEPEVFSTLRNVLATNWTNLESGLTFSVTSDFFGSPVVHELVPGGSDFEVKEENKREFVSRYLDWYFNQSIRSQFEPFCRGFYNVLSKGSLSLFTAQDLFQAICGNEELDFLALKKSTKYEDFYESSETIQHFWQIVVNDFSLDKKKAFLKFLTGSDRAPLKGLIDIKMTITRFGPDSEHLPASHTCFNHLLLPDYKDYQKLKAKLLKSIENCEGFGLF